MSLAQSSFSKRAAPALSLNIASRALSLQVECVGSNKENYPEASTPQLPKKTSFNSKTGVSTKKSSYSTQQSGQEDDNIQEMSFGKSSPLSPLELPEFTPSEPISALLKKTRAQTSYTVDDSPALPEITDISSLLSNEREFNEDLYKRAEEYLDSLHFVIVLPEDHRRRPFGNLRVSTAKVPQSDSTGSEYNSPSLISPSIHTSSLFVRRSSSKKMDRDSSPPKKLSLAKSPFYTCTGKGKRLFGAETTISKEIAAENEEEAAQDKANQKEIIDVVTSLNIKFTGMSLRGSREPSSATSIKMEEDSPLKITGIF